MLLRYNVKNWSYILKHPEVYKQKGALFFLTLLAKYSLKKNTESQNQTTFMQTSVGLQNFINLGNNTCFEGYDLLQVPLNSSKFFFWMSLFHMKEFCVS